MEQLKELLKQGDNQIKEIKQQQLLLIKNFIKEKEQKFDGNKIKLMLIKVKDSFREEKLSKFFQLGYKNSLNIQIFEEEDYRTIRTKRQIFNCIVNNERIDVFDFLIKNKYLICYYFMTKSRLFKQIY